MTAVRTRFAPSPSGHLHVGGARTALFCWAFARAHDGVFILRIEDTDQKRSSDAASLGFLADLTWLGLNWDEGPGHPDVSGDAGGGDRGPYFQSARRDLYDEHLARLIADGHAYPAFETPEELDAARAERRSRNETYRYDRASLALDPDEVARRLADGQRHVIRFKTPDEGEIVVEDEVLGAVTVAASEMDDFVIRKADGFPTYHFAVVVDDELMGVTHVLRGQEHLNNTARHVLLQEALGFRRPVYAHLSLIFNPDGSKMSKRDKDKTLRRFVKEHGIESAEAVDAETWAWWRSGKDHQLDPETGERLAAELGVALPEINVEDFRRAGYLPEVMVNYLALLGWSPGENVEKFDVAFLLERFGLDRIIKSPARFDRDKLLAFNLDAIQALPAEDFADRFTEHVRRFHPEFIERLAPEAFRMLAIANHPRSKTLEDPIRSCRFFLAPDDAIEYEQSKAVRKALVNGDPNGYAHLEAVTQMLRDLDDWTVDGLEGVVRTYADGHADGKLGKVAQPLRIAVSGGTVSPAIWETLVILGKGAVLARIDRCLAHREMLSRT